MFGVAMAIQSTRTRPRKSPPKLLRAFNFGGYFGGLFRGPGRALAMRLADGVLDCLWRQPRRCWMLPRKPSRQMSGLIREALVRLARVESAPMLGLDEMHSRRPPRRAGRDNLDRLWWRRGQRLGAHPFRRRRWPVAGSLGRLGFGRRAAPPCQVGSGKQRIIAPGAHVALIGHAKEARSVCRRLALVAGRHAPPLAQRQALAWLRTIP